MLENEVCSVDITSLDRMCIDSIELVKYARESAMKQVNVIQTMTYYCIGKWIVEEQQKGEKRAKYGKQILKQLSETLNAEFGRGFSVDTLENMRKFYLVYQDRISENLYRNFAVEKSEKASRILDDEKPFALSWSHYVKLMRIEDESARKFYEIESIKNSWSLPELKRQCGSALFERLALSTDKDGVKQLAEKGHVVEKASDIVKDPYVLEFLGLEEKSKYSESELENRILDNLQKFLLELGTGFTFVARQKRFTFDEDHFRVDLVFYNRLLKCFVLFDLKIGELKHQDLGQMQMYVNYYDRYEKTDEENPTIGVLLCNEKNDALVELTLPEDSNIYASKYQLYLPDKKLLKEKLQEWLQEEGEIGGE
jgi:predicted nuclease of restriction endonuclease-like (RecB) superfamily